MKKTTLDEGASIYQKREDRMDAEKWKQMSRKEKLEYFRDYYLLRVIIGALVILAAGYVFWSFFGPKEETVLYVGIVNDAMDSDAVEELTGELEQVLDADGKRRIVLIDTAINTENEVVPKLQVYVMAGQIDVIISGQETIEKLAREEYLANARDILSQEGMDFAGGLSYVAGDMGVSLEKAERLKGKLVLTEKPVFAFAQNSSHHDNAALCMAYLLGEETAVNIY